MTVRRLAVHTSAALAVMAAASGVGALLLPADATFLLHGARPAARSEALLLLPLLAVLVAGVLALRLRRHRAGRAAPLPPALIHLLAVAHLNVVASGFSRSGRGGSAAWAAAGVVLVVAVGTALAAIRALDDVEVPDPD